MNITTQSETQNLKNVDWSCHGRYLILLIRSVPNTDTGLFSFNIRFTGEQG